MNYSLDLTSEAILDIEKHKKAGDKGILNKIDNLFSELRENPAFEQENPKY